MTRCCLRRTSKTLWEWHTTSCIVFRCLVPLIMLLIMHQPHLHQPWRLDPVIHPDICNPVIHSIIDVMDIAAVPTPMKMCMKMHACCPHCPTAVPGRVPPRWCSGAYMQRIFLNDQHIVPQVSQEAASCTVAAPTSAHAYVLSAYIILRSAPEPPICSKYAAGLAWLLAVIWSWSMMHCIAASSIST